MPSSYGMEYRHLSPPRGARSRGFSVIEMLIVLLLFGIVAAIAVPLSRPAVGGYRLAGTARNLAYEISLAKMRAAANFSRARLYVDLGGRSYRIEGWDAASSTWTTEGGTDQLPQGVGFGYSGITTAPPNTQGAISQAALCRDGAGALIADSACVVFNSRGIPVDHTGTPTGANAVYITDGSAVYGATVAATGMTQLWWTPTRVLAWQKQ